MSVPTRAPWVAACLVACEVATLVGAQPAGGQVRLGRLTAQYIKSVRFWAKLQRGGWCTKYSPRTLLPIVGPRCRERDPGTVTLSGKGATERVVWALLVAYEATGEPELLDIARRAGDCVVDVQFGDGHWSALNVVIDGKLVPAHTHGVGGYLGLEDFIQQYPIYALAYLYRVTGEAKYLDAAVKGAEAMLEAQNPNGSFPQYYDPVQKLPKGYGYGVINDNASIEPILVFHLMHLVTGDRRFLEPIPRVGDWLISTYRKGKAMRGWAQQYDKENEPCWARPFEPPAWSRAATMQGLMGLFEVHALTRDEKYLEPIRDVLPVLERTFIEDKGWPYYADWDTGEQVLAQSYKVSVPPKDTPQWARRFLIDIPLDRVRARLDAWDRRRAISLISFRGSHVEKMPGPLEKTGGSIKGLLDVLESKLSGRTPQGYTVRPTSDGDTISPLYDLIDPPKVLQEIAIRQGKLPPHCGTRSRFIHFRVWPDGDWYNTPLRRDGGYRPKASSAEESVAAVGRVVTPYGGRIETRPRPDPVLGLDTALRAHSTGAATAGRTDLTFRCTFEHEQCDADFALGRPEQNGVGWQHAPGRSGKGALIDGPTAYARYVALRNVPVNEGTVSLWVRSKPGVNIWHDGRDHFILVLQTRQFLRSKDDPQRTAHNNQLWLVKRGDGNELELSVQRGIHDSRRSLGRVVLPVAALAPDAWHRIRASWDNRRQQIALRVGDDKAAEASVSGQIAPQEWALVYVGNSHIYRRPLPLNGLVDDLEFVSEALAPRQ